MPLQQQGADKEPLRFLGFFVTPSEVNLINVCSIEGLCSGLSISDFDWVISHLSHFQTPINI